jgi:hypothetical protein
MPPWTGAGMVPAVGLSRLFLSLFAIAVNRVAVRHGALSSHKPPISMARIHNRRTVSTVSRAYSRDPLERIESIAGVNSDRTRWTFTQADAIARIEAGTDAFSIKTNDQVVKLVVHVYRGEKYLQSEREKTHPDDLLKLTASQAVPGDS